MDKSLSKYVERVAGYISQVFPSLQFRGSNDVKVIERWYHLGIPDKSVMSYVTEMEESAPKSLKELQKEIINRFKIEKRKEKKNADMLLRSYVSPQERLRYLYTSLQAILLSLPVDNVIILEKLREMEDFDNDLIEKELESFEEVFYKFLYSNSQERNEIFKKATDRIASYRFYWDEKVCKMTLKALIKKLLKEKYEVPDFTIVAGS